MKIRINTYLELLGTFILLVAFVWQMHSVYMSQWVTNAKLYKFEKALDQILMCEVDEAIKDSTRYKGEAVMRVDYYGVRNFSEAYYEDANRIKKMAGFGKPLMGMAGSAVFYRKFVRLVGQGLESQLDNIR